MTDYERTKDICRITRTEDLWGRLLFRQPEGLFFCAFNKSRREKAYGQYPFLRRRTTEKLQNLLQSTDLKTNYHIHQYELTQEKLYFQWSFFAEKYSVEDISAFVAWFFPRLTEYGVLGIRGCPGCGKEILPLSGHWYMMAHNRTVHYIHTYILPAAAA